MPKLNLNLRGVSSDGPAAVPAGTYAARVVEAQEGHASAESKNPGATTIKLKFKITDSERSADIGSTASMTLVLVDNMMWKVKRTIESITGEVLPSESLDFDTDELVGTACRIVLSVGKWNGRDVNRVEDVLPLAEKKRPGPTMFS